MVQELQAIDVKEGLVFSYFSNGLKIGSELYFPELMPSEITSADVVIKYGSVADRLDNALVTGLVHEASDTEFLLNIDKVARYLIKDKSLIIVDKYPGADENEVRTYILSTIFGILLHKHDILTLHASCIKKQEGAFLFSGASGAGKSTAALGLYDKGYSVLNDDISSVFFHDSKPHIYSGYAHLKLWEKSLADFGYDFASLRPIRKGIKKYSFPLEGERQPETVPLKAIFFIVVKDMDGLSVSKIDGLAAFDILRKNTFRYSIFKALGQLEEHFNFCSMLAAKVPIRKIERSHNVSPKELADFLELCIQDINDDL